MLAERTVKVGMFELDGTLVKKWEVPTRKEENGKYILPDVAASIRKVLNEQNISLNEVAGADSESPARFFRTALWRSALTWDA